MKTLKTTSPQGKGLIERFKGLKIGQPCLFPPLLRFHYIAPVVSSNVCSWPLRLLRGKAHLIPQCFDQRLHQLRHGASLRVACRDVGNQRLPALRLQRGHHACDPAHNATPTACKPLLTPCPWHEGLQKNCAPLRSATVPMSLSPRPERFTSRC